MMTFAACLSHHSGNSNLYLRSFYRCTVIAQESGHSNTWKIQNIQRTAALNVQDMEPWTGYQEHLKQRMNAIRSTSGLPLGQCILVNAVQTHLKGILTLPCQCTRYRRSSADIHKFSLFSNDRVKLPGVKVLAALSQSEGQSNKCFVMSWCSIP